MNSLPSVSFWRGWELPLTFSGKPTAASAFGVCWELFWTCALSSHVKFRRCFGIPKVWKSRLRHGAMQRTKVLVMFFSCPSGLCPQCQLQHFSKSIGVSNCPQASCLVLRAPGQPWASGTHRELACKVCAVVSGWCCSPGFSTQLWVFAAEFLQVLPLWVPHSIPNLPHYISSCSNEGKKNQTQYLFRFKSKCGCICAELDSQVENWQEIKLIPC